MPATPARIGFIQNEFRRAVASDTAVKALFGSLARESADPIETWFDNVADAQTMASARLALLSPQRRRFRISTTGVEDVIDAGLMTGAKLARQVDPDLNVDRTVIVSEITIDLERDSASLLTWG